MNVCCLWGWWGWWGSHQGRVCVTRAQQTFLTGTVLEVHSSGALNTSVSATPPLPGRSCAPCSLWSQTACAAFWGRCFPCGGHINAAPVFPIQSSCWEQGACGLVQDGGLRGAEGRSVRQRARAFEHVQIPNLVAQDAQLLQRDAAPADHQRPMGPDRCLGACPATALEALSKPMTHPMPRRAFAVRHDDGPTDSLTGSEG